MCCENFVDFVFRSFENWIFSCNHYNCKCRPLFGLEAFFSNFFKTARYILDTFENKSTCTCMYSYACKTKKKKKEKNTKPSVI